MAGPPPYSPPAPRRPNTALIIVLVLGGLGLACLIIIGLFAYTGVGMFRQHVQPMAECAIGFEDVRGALRAYAEANEGRLPDAETWEDDVRPYFRDLPRENRGPFGTFPVDGPWGCRTGDAVTGVAFNADLSGKRLAEIESPQEVMLVFEVPESGRNLHRAYEPLPDEQAPKAFGAPRGWVTMPVQGGLRGLDVDDGQRRARASGTGE
jgi:hypothetical protein